VTLLGPLDIIIGKINPNLIEIQTFFWNTPLGGLPQLSPLPFQNFAVRFAPWCIQHNPSLRNWERKQWKLIKQPGIRERWRTERSAWHTWGRATVWSAPASARIKNSIKSNLLQRIWVDSNSSPFGGFPVGFLTKRWTIEGCETWPPSSVTVSSNW